MLSPVKSPLSDRTWLAPLRVVKIAPSKTIGSTIHIGCSTGEDASVHCDTIGQMLAATESVRIDPGMDLKSRMFWYLGWNPRPLYMLSAAMALLGAIAFRSPAGLLFGVLPMLARWKAAALVNARAPSIIELAKNRAVISGANRVGVRSENSDHTVLSTARSSSVPSGVRASREYTISVTYVCDTFFAIYTGTSFTLPTCELRLAITGEEVYFRHVSAINRSNDSIEIVLTRSNKSRRIPVGGDPNATALLELLRSRLRNPRAVAPEPARVEVPGDDPQAVAPPPLEISGDDNQRYCYIRAAKLMEYYADPVVLSALMEQLQVPGTTAIHNQMNYHQKKAAIEDQIEHFRQTPTSFWYGVAVHEVLAASIWRARGIVLSERVIRDKFYDVAREEDLRRPIARWLEALNETPYMEIQLGRRRIDVLGYKKSGALGSPRLTAVELKNSDEEFRRGPDQMGSFAEYSHAVYLACTAAFAAEYLERNAGHRSVNHWDPTLLDRKLKQGGFGLPIVERDHVFEVVKPVEQTPSAARVATVVSRLPAFHKIDLD